MKQQQPKIAFWKEGPAKWIFTAYGILLATAHLVAAGFNVGKFFELFEIAWPFYASLIGITSTAAVFIHRGAQARAGTLGNFAAPQDAFDPPRDTEEEAGGTVPRAPR